VAPIACYEGFLTRDLYLTAFTNDLESRCWLKPAAVSVCGIGNETPISAALDFLMRCRLHRA
jgi:hypothetical protein